MPRNETTPRGLGASVLRVLGVLVPVLALGFLVVQQANFLVGRGLNSVFGGIETTYRSAWFEWDGDLVAKDVVVYPFDGAEDVTVRFDALQLETPGWPWLLRNMFDRKLRTAKLDRLHLTLSGVTSYEGVDPTLGDLGPVGPVSASPFEAAGCLRDDLWIGSELGEMGLKAATTTLDLDYRIEGTHLKTAIVLDTPGVSTVRLAREERIGPGANALVLDGFQTATTSERWQVVDQGFVRKRNAWCAKKDGTTQEAFVDRHVDSVLRQLRVLGMAPDAASVAAYRAFASEGGTLSFGGQYAKPLHSSDFYAVRDNGSAFLGMHGILERQGQRHAVQWSRFDPQPLGGREDDTVFAALQRERGIDPFAADGAPVSTPGLSAASAARIKASSAPVAALAAPGSRVAWEALPAYRGHVFQIWTMHNPPRQMKIEGTEGNRLLVRANVGGGHATYRITREAFLRAILVH